MSGTGAYAGGFVVDGFSQKPIKAPIKIRIISEHEEEEIIAVHAYHKARQFKLNVTKFLSSKALMAVLIAVLSVGIVSALIIVKPDALRFGKSLITTKSAPSKVVLPAFSELVDSKQVNSKVEAISKQTVAFTIGSTVVNPSRSDISKWLVVKKSGNKSLVAVNQVALTNYIDSLISKYSTLPVDKVTVTHPDGSTAVLQTGRMGVQYSGTDNIVYAVAGKLLGGGGNSVSFPGITTGYKTTNTTDYTALLEVDVSTKRMYAYQNGQLIKTFLVTAGAPRTPTPLGTFHIWSKVRMKDMRGFNPNGTKYFQPNVHWISYFDHRGDAIHGNYWRPLSYFGNVNSSHGCVGVVNAEALWVYNWAPVGTTVIIHA